MRVQKAQSALGALRYAGVLAVWCGLFLVRPALALQILRERRADSPLPRWPAAPHAFASASTR